LILSGFFFLDGTQTWYTRGMETVAKIPGLQRRNLTWYLRVRVPKDLLDEFKTKEIIESLKTRDYDTAAKRVHTVRSGIEAIFEKKRQAKKAQKNNHDMLSGYSEHELTALAIKWFNGIKTKEKKMLMQHVGEWSAEERADYHLELKQSEHAARLEVQGIHAPDIHGGSTMAARFLKAEGISYDNQTENFAMLGHFFSQAINELAQKRLKDFEGKSHHPTDDMFVATSQQIGYGGTALKSISMGDLVKTYLSDPRVTRSASTVKNYQLIKRAIDEVIGNQTIAWKVTREQCRYISDLLVKFPSNAHKKIKFKTIVEAVKIGTEKGLPTISDSTFNTYMHKFHALMEYAVNESFMPMHQAKNLTVKSVMRAKERRNPFNNDQLTKIFSSAIYTERREEALAYNPNGTDPKIYAKFWVPLISLWTGMRLNEICQLDLSDIKLIDGVQTIIIRETDDDGNQTDKKVKTKSGVRWIPIHHTLIKMGLLNYIASIEAAGETKVFPDLKKDDRGYFSSTLSKWFARHLKKLGAKTARTNFHSLRHTFRDAVKKANISKDYIQELGGWSSGTTDEIYGSSMANMKELDIAIQKITYDGLDLSHLHS